MLSLPKLIKCAPLNFCCTAAFFATNRGVRTGLLAARLGLGERTVRKWRARWKEGKLGCSPAPACLIETAPKGLQRHLKRRINKKEKAK